MDNLHICIFVVILLILICLSICVFRSEKYKPLGKDVREEIPILTTKEELTKAMERVNEYAAKVYKGPTILNQQGIGYGERAGGGDIRYIHCDRYGQ